MAGIRICAGYYRRYDGKVVYVVSLATDSDNGEEVVIWITYPFADVPRSVSYTHLALALAIPMAAGNIRVFRSSLLDGYNSDFVLYARARGVSEWKIANLVSRFALPPLITMLAQSFGFMIAGSAMVESVFSIPGLGSMPVSYTHLDVYKRQL